MIPHVVELERVHPIGCYTHIICNPMIIIQFDRFFL